MTQTLRARLFGLSLLFVAGACDPSDPCDSGYYEEHGACYPVRAPAGDGDGDAGSDGDDEDGGREPSDADAPSMPYEGFGDECEEQSDCPNGLVCAAPQLRFLCPPEISLLEVTY